MKQKRGLYIIIGIFVFIILLVLIFLFSRIMKNDNFVVSNFEISLSNNASKDEFKNLGPISDDDSDIVTPYKFKIVNTDSNSSTYNLLIEDIIENDKEQDYLSRNYLHYELELNGVVVKKGNLDEIKNNIIDTRTMDKGTTNNYSLKIWISKDAKDRDWMNKYYSYNISVEPIKE